MFSKLMPHKILVEMAYTYADAAGAPGSPGLMGSPGEQSIVPLTTSHLNKQTQQPHVPSRSSVRMLHIQQNSLIHHLLAACLHRGGTNRTNGSDWQHRNRVDRCGRLTSLTVGHSHTVPVAVRPCIYQGTCSGL